MIMGSVAVARSQVETKEKVPGFISRYIYHIYLQYLGTRCWAA